MSERSVSPYERYGIANPVSDAALQTHVYKATDSLTGLAQKYYGDWRQWRLIAERNNITDPRQIVVGFELIIPRKPLEVGRYESA